LRGVSLKTLRPFLKLKVAAVSLEPRVILALSRQPAKSVIVHYFHSKELDFDLHQREVVIGRYFVQKGISAADIERIERRIGLAMPQHIFRLIVLLVACAVIGYAAKRGFTVKSFYEYGHCRSGSVAQTGDEMPGSREPAHVCADLGYDDLRTERADARD